MFAYLHQFQYLLIFYLCLVSSLQYAEAFRVGYANFRAHESHTSQRPMTKVLVWGSAGRFTGIVIYRGVLIAPVQRFHHNSTGYDRILSNLFVRFIEVKNVIACVAWKPYSVD